MKKFSIINGVQTAGMSLIALAVIGGLTLKVANPSTINNSVLSDTTASISMYVINGGKTLSETPYRENGFPDFEGGASAIKIELDPVAPVGSTVTFTTNDDCILFSDAAGGGIYHQTKTDSINALYLIAIGAVDDLEYEGDHACKLSAVFSSSDPNINGQKRYISFTIKDNDPKPDAEKEEKETTESKDLSNNQTIKPDTPVAKLYNKNGIEIESSAQDVKFEDGEEITITGTTVANGEVKLYIFSEPQEASVIADNDGVWSHTIEKIEPGNHRIEAEVFDPATGETSERAQVLAFEVAQYETVRPAENTVAEQANSSVTEDSSTGLLLAVGASLLMLILGIIGLVVYKKKHPHHENELSSEAINPSDGMGSDS